MVPTLASDAPSPDVRQGIRQQSAQQEPPSSVKSCPLARTWVEFVLLDMEGNPVSGQRYKVGLPDGTTRQGTLDATGTVRVEGIRHGTCTISFVDLDQDAWESI
jgi:hypothetical protein